MNNPAESTARERQREYSRRYRQRHPERARESTRRYEAATGRGRERQRRLRAADPDRVNKIARRYRDANPDRVAESQAQYRARARAAVFAHYGQECACCGRADRLTVDHIDGNGREHRVAVFGASRVSSTRIYTWLIREGFPAGFQVLCVSCNRSKGTGEHCQINHRLDGAR